MKKSFKYYAIAWTLMLAAFNVIVFTVQTLSGRDASFWVSWGFIIASFIGQLFCAYTAYKSENLDKLFLNIPLITESYGAVVLMTLAGSICMLIPNCPMWIATVVCVVLITVSAVSLINAKAAGEIVGNVVSEKVKTHTFFIKSLTVDTDTLMTKGQTPEIKAELKKVYDAIRYSDPMSNDALVGTELQITIAFEKLSKAVENNDLEDVKARSNELLILVNDRNKKCKLLLK